MKKKAKTTVRKVTRTKKTVSRSQKTKKFSLKKWLLGGLVVVLAIAYGYYQMQPKTLKVLEIPGELSDYVNPQKASIDLVQVANNNLAKSDSPEAAAYTAVYQQKVTKAAKNETITEEEIVKTAAKAAAQTIQMNIEQNKSATPVEQTKAQQEYKVATQIATGTNMEDIPSDQGGSVDSVKNIINTAVNIANSVDLVCKEGTECKKASDYTPVLPSFTQAGGQGTCRTNAGTNVLAGSLMIGPVEQKDNRHAGENTVYECRSDGGWQQKAGLYCKAGDYSNCPITVKPTYALNKELGEANCYQGNLLIGQGQKINNDAGGKDICDKGVLVKLTKVVLGGTEQYLTAAELAERAKSCNDNELTQWNPLTNTCGGSQKACEKIGGTWTQNNCSLANAEKFAKEFDECKGKGSGYSWDYTTKTCVEKPSLTLPSNKVPGVTTSQKVSSEIVPGVSNYTGQECEIAAKANPGYTCEPIANGMYYKLTPPSDKPAYAPSNTAFDNPGNSGSNLTPEQTKQLNNPSQPWAADNPLLVKNEDDCPDNSTSDTVYLPNDNGPIYRCFPVQQSEKASSLSNTPGGSGYLSKFDDKRACNSSENMNGSLECVKTPDGKWTQFSEDSPNIDCRWTLFNYINGCQWIDDNGKYFIGSQCKSNDQCSEGLFCMHRSLQTDICASSDIQTLKSGDSCTLFLDSAEKLCANCPNGYSLTSGTKCK